MRSFNGLASVVPPKTKPRSTRKAKPLSPEERRLLKLVQGDLVTGITDARKLAGMTQTALLEKAHLSPEMLRKWKNGTSSPTLRSLVVLLKVLDRRPAVQLVATAQPSTTLAEAPREDAAMPDDDLNEKFDSLSERKKGRVEGYVDALAGGQSRPPSLTEPPSAQPGQKK